MSEEKKSNKLSFLDNLKFVKKIKQVKHIGIIVVVIFVLILLLILFSDINLNFQSKNETFETSTYTSYYQYAEKLESKLKNLLGRIKGAGNVEVMITLDGGTTMQYVTDEERTTVASSGQTTVSVSNSAVLINDEPIVKGERLPTITGVVIVSSGAKDTNVRLNLLTATQTLLDLSQNKIQIFVGN